MMEKIFFISFLVLGISSIGIPIRMGESQCMIVYSVGESQSVKIEAQLPKIPGQLSGEHYEITILNTETNQLVTENYQSGTYKRQLALSPNIIYEVCFKVRSDREYGRVIIQYSAENLFNVDHKEIIVPDNLLKSGDFKISYQSAEKLKVVTQKFKQLQTARKESQSTTFVQTTGLNQWLIYISAGEIGIIIVTAIYQFFSLHSFLSKKQLV